MSARTWMHALDILSAIAILSFSAFFALWMWVDVRQYIDLHRVTIDAVVEGEMPVVEVSRTIKRDFHGGYHVEIREHPSLRAVCSTGDVEHLYRQRADIGEHESLAWWAAGGGCNSALVRPVPLQSGSFVVETCHFVTRPWGILPKMTRCVESNVFRVFGPDDPLPSPIEQRLHK